MTTAERLRASQAEGIAALRELAADRPKHLAYIDAMLAAGSVDMDDVPRPVGVTGSAADAMWEDVAWLTYPVPDDYAGGMSQYPHAYRDERYRLARENAKAKQRKEAGRGLQELLRF